MNQSFIDAFVKKRIHNHLPCGFCVGDFLPCCSLVGLSAKPDGLYFPGMGLERGLGGGLYTGFIPGEYGLAVIGCGFFSADDMGPAGGLGRPFTPGVIVLGGGGLGDAAFF